MALNIPGSASEVDQKMKVDVQSELPLSNPFLKNAWLGAILTAIANRQFDFYLQLIEAQKQGFPDTATDDDLDRWAAIWSVIRLAATTAIGNIAFTGTVTTTIPSGTTLADSTGALYDTTAEVDILGQSISVSSLVRAGSTVTATTAVEHNLANNVPVTISGAVETDYNVTDTAILVISTTVFTYTIADTPTTPATGTILAGVTFASVPVISQGFGVEVNQDLNATVTLQSPIAGVDNDTQVDADLISGGTDQENDTALQLRLLDRIQNPVAHFNVADIVAKAKEINGTTRVFVEEVTPSIGQVTVYFMRDNSTPSIPTGPQVTAMKTKLLTIKPANTGDADLIVSAPTGLNVDFTFTDLSPNTATMQLAVIASLQQFFDENTTVGVNIDEDKYKAAIANTVDTSTGDTVVSFVLSAPSGDVIITSGEIGVLNVITYP